MTLKETPLHSLHVELGGRMVDFAGWHMPVQYHSALKEHLSVRESVGLFDVSHMGEIEISGPRALESAQSVTCNDLSRIEDSQAQYSAFLTTKGTFVDDVVIYRIDENRLLICVNAANKDKDLAFLREHLEGRAEVTDRSHEFAQIAVQGPKAETVLQELTGDSLSAIRYYSFIQGRVDGAPALISRTGYTGEDGFEIYVPPESAPSIWLALLEAGKSSSIVSAGLAARNTLRLEVCYPLYGNDIDETTTPLEAGLRWIVKLKKDFLGRQALLAQKAEGLKRKLVGFELLDRGIARDGYPVFVDGQPFGQVRSGSFAPSLQRNVGLTYLPKRSASIDSEFEIDVRGKRLRAKVVPKPFYKRD